MGEEKIQKNFQDKFRRTLSFQHLAALKGPFFLLRSSFLVDHLVSIQMRRGLLLLQTEAEAVARGSIRGRR